MKTLRRVLVATDNSTVPVGRSMPPSEAGDMIVVGKRGRGRLAGLLLGSISQHIINLAPCSVHVVP